MPAAHTDQNQIISASIAELRGKGPKLLPLVLLLLVTCRDRFGRVSTSSFSEDLKNLAGILSFGSGLDYAIRIAFPRLPDSIREELPNLDKDEIPPLCSSLRILAGAIEEVGKKEPYIRDKYRTPFRLVMEIVFETKQACENPTEVA